MKPIPDGEVIVDYKTSRLMVVVDTTRPATSELEKTYGVVPWNTYGQDDDAPFRILDVEYIHRSRLGAIRAVSRNVHDE